MAADVEEQLRTGKVLFIAAYLLLGQPRQCIAVRRSSAQEESSAHNIIDSAALVPQGSVGGHAQ